MWKWLRSMGTCAINTAGKNKPHIKTHCSYYASRYCLQIFMVLFVNEILKIASLPALSVKTKQKTVQLVLHCWERFSIILVFWQVRTYASFV